MDGVKTLDVQHPGTRRRMEGGTVVQLITEQERSVSAPALWPQVAALRCSVAAKPISGDPVKWWSVERKSEEGIVAVIDVDNTTRRSEGPPARCARPTGEGARDCRERLFVLSVPLYDDHGGSLRHFGCHRRFGLRAFVGTTNVATYGGAAGDGPAPYRTTRGIVTSGRRRQCE